MLTLTLLAPSFTHLKAPSTLLCRSTSFTHLKVPSTLLCRSTHRSVERWFINLLIVHGYQSADGPEIIILQTNSSIGSFHIHTFSPLPNHSKTEHGYIRGPITNVKVICFSSFYLRTIPSLNDLHPLFPSSLWIIRAFLTISRVPVKIFSPS